MQVRSRDAARRADGAQRFARRYGLAFLDRDFVVNRLGEVSYDTAALWRETSISPDDYAAWRAKNAKKLESVSGAIADAETAGITDFTEVSVEVSSQLEGGRTFLHRLLFPDEAAATGFINGL